ncbi:DNA alkylation repair protein [Bacillus sp. FJAT-45350]|uniref:DNA alkylation repair protein n=1 Tax=Bacillus sp. FJAT-45350 TaxID=2011014 RepID=UPI000BB7586B|nr:DNA alkylation repair protein [Bacillus sp. FJAT-45350]
MAGAYCCPNCKTNRTRFNIIQQQASSVKLNPQTGEVVEDYSNKQLDPFHLPYRGPELKVQCGACGVVEDEIRYVSQGRN